MMLARRAPLTAACAAGRHVPNLNLLRPHAQAAAPGQGGRRALSWSQVRDWELRKKMMSGRPSCTADSEAVGLSKRKCVPCESKQMRPMTRESADALLPQVGGWEMLEEESKLRLHRGWTCKSFVKGLEFLKLVAQVAEEEGHHPDLHLVSWNKVGVDITTHSVGGLTENDFILAAKINDLEVAHLLRRSKPVVPPGD